MSPRNFLVRGLIAGFVASLFSFLIAYTVGEPQVDAAIAVEEAASAAVPAEEPAVADDGHSHAEEASGTEVSRDDQATWGLATGIITVGTALGGVVGLASAFAVGRIGRLRPSQSTALVAAVGYVAFSLVPFLKYPATPPAVGNGETIGDRTLYFFIVQAVSLLAAIAAVVIARRLLGPLGTYRAVLATAGGYLAVVVVTALAMPTVNEIGDFPADTLWYFRLSSLLTNATLWAVIGIVLVGLVGKLHQQETITAARKDLAASL